jgi:hypothetical protein
MGKVRFGKILLGYRRIGFYRVWERVRRQRETIVR